MMSTNSVSIIPTNDLRWGAGCVSTTPIVRRRLENSRELFTVNLLSYHYRSVYAVICHPSGQSHCVKDSERPSLWRGKRWKVIITERAKLEE